MLSGAVTGSSSSAAGSATAFGVRGLTAASATLRGTDAASADFNAGLTTGVAAKSGFALGIGTGSIAAVSIGFATGGGARAATGCTGATITEDCLSGATPDGGALVALGVVATGFSGTTTTGVLGAALGAGVYALVGAGVADATGGSAGVSFIERAPGTGGGGRVSSV
jgi:hypothetical protein